jgi:hypothetical protein
MVKDFIVHVAAGGERNVATDDPLSVAATLTPT